MKNTLLLLLLCVLCVSTFAACAHTHSYTAAAPVEASCAVGAYVRYTCTCGDFYDEETAPALGHVMTKTEGIAVTCDSDGRPEYYTCSRCEKYYADERGSTELAESELVIPAGHRTTHHPSREPLRFEDGNWEYWQCNSCSKIFLNDTCTWEATLEEVTITSAFNMVDFAVEVEEGRDPVILQLTDPQFSNVTEMEERAYKYMRETILATKPDLILVTGDLVYGKYDHDGIAFSSFIDFMESFGIPWAPVFGNHDNESDIGVDWQCAQLEAAEHCLFKQGDLTGNGNYTVGIAQGERLSRVFYMLDSNGCSAPGTASVGKVRAGIGFGEDQLAWVREGVERLYESEPGVKISLAFHIQLSVFSEAMNRYQEYFKYYTDTINRVYPKLWLDKFDGTKNGDFGIIGCAPTEAIDKDKKVWNMIQSLGIDSVFVGHEHCNNFSIVYEGVRLQYGMKSTGYDSYNWIKDGKMGSGWHNNGWNAPAGATPLIGGSVLTMGADGSFKGGYIYLCGEIPEYNP